MEKKITWGVAVVSVLSLSLFAFPTIVGAATVTFDADTTVTLPGNGVSFTILDGGKAESVVANSTTLAVTTASDTGIFIRNTSRFTLNVSSGAIVISTCTSTYSQVHIAHNGTDDTLTITPDTSVKCFEPVGGGPTGGSGTNVGGGGGGGGGGAAKPTNTSVIMNSDDEVTTSRQVTLTLKATGANDMLISNQSSFVNATWETYATSKAWTLTEGNGVKTVYVKYRKTSGGISNAAIDTIELTSKLPDAVSGTITAGSGGNVGLADNSLSINVPGGALSGNGTISITPTDSYIPPSGNLGVVAGRVYDLEAKVDNSINSEFSSLINLTFKYNDADVSGISEGSLKVYFWDADAGIWILLGGTVNTATNTITVSTDHFTLFGVFGDVTFGAGELVSLDCAADAGTNDPCKAVYYLGADGKRYVFPNAQTYATWYDDFLQVKSISLADLSTYLIGGNVTYRPGKKLVKIQSDPKVYAVSQNGGLRWIATEAVATALYGADWATKVDDISASFFVNYSTGVDINAAADYSPSASLSGSVNINQDKGL